MLSKEFINFNIIVSKKYTVFFCLFVYSIILLFFCSGFSPLYSFNIWCDVNVYYTIGKGLFFGKIPYQDLFDHKGPIIFFIYGLGYILSPNSFFGMYILQAVSLSISLFCIYLISNLFLFRQASIFLTFIFPFFLFFFTSIGGAAEEFILSMMFISLYFFIKYFYSNTPLHKPFIMFLHGILIGLVFLIKANLIIFWLFPIVIILYFQLRYKTSLFFKNLLFLTIGFFLVFLSITFYFLHNNALEEFINAYFILNIKYGSIPYTGIKNYILGIFYHAFVVFNLDKVSFLLSLFGILYFAFSKILTINKIIRVGLFLTFVATLLILLSSPILMQYYFIISCIFVPLGIISICHLLAKYRVFHNKYLYYILCFCSFFLIIYSRNFLLSPFDYKSGDKFEGDKEVIYRVSEIINTNTDQSLLSIGIDVGVDIFTKNNIVPDVKYFFTPNIVIEKGQYLYDEQKDYIRQGSTNFLIMNNYYRYKTFFEMEINKYYIPILVINDYTLYQRK